MQTITTVAAAADLQFALPQIAAQFERETGHRVRLVFGSSGTFYAQLLQGAPFDMFLSADESFVFKLAQAGRTDDRGRVYAHGRIGLMVPHGSSVQADSALSDLARALKDGRLQKLAIANPDHAPYGQRAVQALQHAGLWPAVQTKLIFGENIAQATQFALAGGAQGGIVAQSLALAPAIAPLGNFVLIPLEWHQPLVQRMVLMKNAPPGAHAFYAYLRSPAAQTIMSRFGFTPPSDN